MNHLKPIGLAAIAAMALTAFLGAGTASATQLYKYTTPSANDSLGVGTTFTFTLAGSSLFEDTEEALLVDTCTTSEMHGTFEDSAGGHPTGNLSALTFGNCSHTTDVVAKGSIEVRHIAGTTNGTVYSANAQVTFQSTIFGIQCTINTGAGGTLIGTLTGAKSPTGTAVIDINAVLPVGFLCGTDVRWTATYIVTQPAGLAVESGP
jgi:hypothetical protein